VAWAIGGARSPGSYEVADEFEQSEPIQEAALGVAPASGSCGCRAMIGESGASFRRAPAVRVS